MVVVCESCETRFQLDEARIPPKGTLVRCSRCKSTFIVRPPAVDFEETVQDVVAEVTAAGGAPVPEVAEDLFETSSDDLGATLQGSDDDAWEFDEDAEPGLEPTPPPLRPIPGAEARRAPAAEAHGAAAAEANDEPAAEVRESPAAEASQPPLFEAIPRPRPEADARELELASGLELDLGRDELQAPEPEPDSAGPDVAPASDPVDAAEDELGPPDRWDLLGDSVDAAARGATFVDADTGPGDETDPLATTAPAAGRAAAPAAVHAALPTDSEAIESGEDALADVPLPAMDVSPQALGAAFSLEAEAAADGARSGRDRLQHASRSLLTWGGAALRGLAWGGVVAALGFGALAVVPYGPQAVPVETRAALIPLPDGEARGVRVRFVENAFAGTLYVVEGELVRGAAEPTLGLRVQWQDAAGTAIGDPQWAQPLPTDRELRERAPEAWRSAGSAGWVAPTHGRFSAIFERLPEGAASVALRLEPLPGPAQRSAAADFSDALHADPITPGATTPSTPTALPSTE